MLFDKEFNLYLKIFPNVMNTKMRFILTCKNSIQPSANGIFGRRKHVHAKYDFDKMLYRKKIQSAFFIQRDKSSTIHLYQDIIDMSQYFKDEDILYEVLGEMERDLVFDEICLFYRMKRMSTIDDNKYN
jgi:hypothetical protein